MLGSPALETRDLASEARARHATLTSSIDWSWKLLSREEQRALGECSVFAGGFTLDAAEGVLEAPSAGAARTIDVLSGLRDKSLVYVAGDGAASALYASIREYAAARLRSRGPEIAAALRTRHARHFARLFRPFNETALLGPSGDPSLRHRAAADRENLIVALEFARTHPRCGPDDAAVLAELALGAMLLQAAPGEVCVEALRAALDAVGSSDVLLRARLLAASREPLNWLEGGYDEARRNLELLLALEGLPPRMHALAHVAQGVQLRYLSKYREALVSHEAAARELDELDEPGLRASNWACMGRLFADLRDESSARLNNEKALGQAIARGDAALEGLALANLAQLEQELGRSGEATELLHRALGMFRRANEPRYLSLYSATMGQLLFERGQIDEARSWFQAASRSFPSWDAHRGAALCYASWGALEAEHGERELAEALFARARRSAQRGDTPTVRLGLELHEASLRLRAARDARDPRRLAAEEAHWRERARSLQSGDAADADEVACSLEVRFALRRLESSLSLSRTTGSALVIGPGGTWFAWSGSAHVDLRRRGPLRRILVALAEERRDRPGHAVGRDRLIALGWPGERVRHDAAGTRVRVAVATLRRLGLRGVLDTRDDDGYLLDPTARLVFSDGESARIRGLRARVRLPETDPRGAAIGLCERRSD